MDVEGPFLPVETVEIEEEVLVWWLLVLLLLEMFER